MKKLKELALAVYNNTNLQKFYFAFTWLLSIFRGDKFTMTTSFTALLILWYIDKKFEKQKELNKDN